MKISPREAWIISRLLCGRVTVPDGQVEPLDESDRVRPLADQLRSSELRFRFSIWKGFLTGRTDRDDWRLPVGDADPAGPPPPEGDGPGGEDEPLATLDDIKQMVSDTSWPWPGWLAGGVLNTLAADPGVGKTILAMNLARILWQARPWPDGQPNPFPAGTKTLWVPGDRHYPQLIDLAARYGLPGEAMLFNAPPAEPTAGLDLDNLETLDKLEAGIRSRSPGLVIVDTVGMTTERNLSLPEEARAYFSPLMTIAGERQVSFLMLTHLNRSSHVLGRRIVGATRVVWKLTCPDPSGPPDRRKLAVDKTYSVVPPALGLTIADDGCSFDNRPPEAEEGEKRAKASPRLEECKQWLAGILEGGASPVKSIRASAEAEGFGAGLLYLAQKAMGLETVTRGSRSFWTLPGDETPDQPLLSLSGLSGSQGERD